MRTQPRNGIWDHTEFEHSHLPWTVTHLNPSFAVRNNPPIRVLDMPIKFPGTNFRIPAEHTQFTEPIHAAWTEETHYDSCPDELYAYITVDQKPVIPGDSQRRGGCHSDAYVTDPTGAQIDIVPKNSERIAALTGIQLIERTYIAYDNQPTEFFDTPFPLYADPHDCEAIQHGWDAQAEALTPVTFPTCTLLALTPYVVHRAVPNRSGRTLERTFIKIAFSRYRYNREGNTHNPLFDYNWEMVPRKIGVREHRYTH